jgi:hypothetical protein
MPSMIERNPRLLDDLAVEIKTLEESVRALGHPRRWLALAGSVDILNFKE